MKINFYPMDIYGCGFYRMLQPAKVLKEKGIDVVCKYYISEKDFTNPEFDIAILQRPTHKEILNTVVRMLDKGIKLLLDIDDWIFGIPESSPAYEYYMHPVIRNNMMLMMNFATGIITTNNYLANLLKPYNKTIYVFPNYLDFDLWNEFLKYKYNQKKDNLNIIIGWHGSDTHKDDLTLQAESIIKILKEFDNVYFKCVGYDVRRIKEFREVSDKIIFENGTYPTRFGNLLWNFDIGIAPLTDCDFNRSKSPVKYLEYSALKIPCIASPVRPYADEIGNYLSRGVLSTDFYFDLKQLILSKNLRKTIGMNAYDYVRENYNINNHILDYKNLLEGVIK